MRKEYESIMQKFFLSAFEKVNFSQSPDEIRVRINQWVENNTNSKIKDLLPPQSITPSTKMVLVNAIYFKGSWEKMFDSINTSKYYFNLEYEREGEIVEVDMMNIES